MKNQPINIEAILCPKLCWCCFVHIALLLKSLLCSSFSPKLRRSLLHLLQHKEGIFIVEVVQTTMLQNCLPHCTSHSTHNWMNCARVCQMCQNFPGINWGFWKSWAKEPSAWWVVVQMMTNFHIFHLYGQTTKKTFVWAFLYTIIQKRDLFLEIVYEADLKVGAINCDESRYKGNARWIPHWYLESFCNHSVCMHLLCMSVWKPFKSSKCSLLVFKVHLCEASTDHLIDNGTTVKSFHSTGSSSNTFTRKTVVVKSLWKGATQQKR